MGVDPVTPRRASPPVLTARERVALTSVAVGLSRCDAAAQLGICHSTLYRVLADALHLLGAATYAAAVDDAAATGQIDPEHVRARLLPLWPPLDPAADPHDPRARATRAIEEAARRAELERLLAEDVPVGVAMQRVGLALGPARRRDREFLVRRRRAGAGVAPGGVAR